MPVRATAKTLSIESRIYARLEASAHMFVMKFSSIHDFIFDRHSVALFSHTPSNSYIYVFKYMPLRVEQKDAYKKLKVFSFHFLFLLLYVLIDSMYTFHSARMHIHRYNYYSLLLLIRTFSFYVSVANEKKAKNIHKLP